MKILTLLISLIIGCLTTTATLAQQTLWLNANGEITTKEKAVFYRPAPKKRANGYWITTYYANGNKQMEGFSLNNQYNKEQFEGLVQWYFVNKKRSKEYYFIEGKLDGNIKEYYKTGELKEIIRYKKGIREGFYKMYYKNGKIKTRGRYRNNEKVGIWKTFYKNVY